MASSTRSRSDAGGAPGHHALALALLLTLPAAAAPDDAEKAARALVASSQQHYNLGRFAEALADLEKAYQLKPVPGLLFNIAQCHRQLKHYERAAFFYRSFAEQGKGDQVAVARGLAGEMTKLDEQAKAEAAKEAAAEQQRQAALEAQKRRDEEVRTKQQLDLELARLAASKAAAEKAGPPPVYTRWWFWTAIGVVVAAGTVTAVAAAPPPPRMTSLGEVNLR